MMIKKGLLFLALLPLLAFSQNSIGNFTGDESLLYAQTKQMNQFFRRFNGEETVKGDRLYPGDPGYHDSKLRKNYLGMLFDRSNTALTDDVRFVFIEEVNGKKAPVYLDFHSGNWFSEVSADFIYKKEKVNLILYFRLEKQNDGYKWVFSNVYCDRFTETFRHVGDTTNRKYFIHPLSHEIDYMNLNKVFEKSDNIDYYLEDKYEPDMLSIFVTEVKDGNLKFSGVNSVKFHFFQVPNWYFEVSYFNRNSANSGWLISNMVRVNDREKKELIKHYTHVN